MPPRRSAATAATTSGLESPSFPSRPRTRHVIFGAVSRTYALLGGVQRRGFSTGSSSARQSYGRRGKGRGIGGDDRRWRQLQAVRGKVSTAPPALVQGAQAARAPRVPRSVIARRKHSRENSPVARARPWHARRGHARASAPLQRGAVCAARARAGCGLRAMPRTRERRCPRAAAASVRGLQRASGGRGRPPQAVPRADRPGGSGGRSAPPAGPADA